MWEEVYNHHAGVDIVGATPADSAGINLDNLQRHRSPTRFEAPFRLILRQATADRVLLPLPFHQDVASGTAVHR